MVRVMGMVIIFLAPFYTRRIEFIGLNLMEIVINQIESDPSTMEWYRPRLPEGRCERKMPF